jgi:hypothetical protein
MSICLAFNRPGKKVNGQKPQAANIGFVQAGLEVEAFNYLHRCTLVRAAGILLGF